MCACTKTFYPDPKNGYLSKFQNHHSFKSGGGGNSMIVSPRIRFRMDIFRALLIIFGNENNDNIIDGNSYFRRTFLFRTL